MTQNLNKAQLKYTKIQNNQNVCNSHTAKEHFRSFNVTDASESFELYGSDYLRTRYTSVIKKSWIDFFVFLNIIFFLPSIMVNKASCVRGFLECVVLASIS